MSNEESCWEEDENGRMKVVGYKVKRLSWESRKLKKIKDLLDNAVKERQTQRARDRTLPRTDHQWRRQLDKWGGAIYSYIRVLVN